MGLSEYNFEKYYLFLDKQSSKINPFSNELIGQRFNEFDRVFVIKNGNMRHLNYTKINNISLF